MLVQAIRTKVQRYPCVLSYASDGELEHVRSDIGHRTHFIEEPASRISPLAGVSRDVRDGSRLRVRPKGDEVMQLS